MKVEITLLEQMNPKGTAILPQAELLTGATGYLLALQTKDKVYVLGISSLIDLILKEENKESLAKSSAPEGMNLTKPGDITPCD